ncbi:MAG: hypothetical protein U5K30_17690 [Acidimicrobiales bacterium]|nr:hypothetical protein [Acidimicrobiales bacterium]
MNDRPDIGNRPVATWVRLALVALAVPNLLTGLWALVDPQGWFDGFPGFDPRLVAAEPPFNEHLATDAGAGLLASGVVLLAAAWFADGRSVRLGLIAYGCFAIPHAAWHTVNPSEPLTAAEDVQNATTLLVAAIATIGLYVYVSRAAPGTTEVPA